MHYKHDTSHNPKDLPPAGFMSLLFNAAHDNYPMLRHQHERALETMMAAPKSRVVAYPCFVDGKATTAVGIMDMVGNKVFIIPLFIAPTGNMKITGHAGQPTMDDPFMGGE